LNKDSIVDAAVVPIAVKVLLDEVLVVVPLLKLEADAEAVLTLIAVGSSLCRLHLPQKAHPMLRHLVEPLEEHALGQLIRRRRLPLPRRSEAALPAPSDSSAARSLRPTYFSPGSKNSQLRKNRDTVLKRDCVAESATGSAPAGAFLKYAITW
jgi:hypothetical protein